MVQHNDCMVRHRIVDGWPEREAFIWKEQRGWVRFTTEHGPYLCGFRKPRYPVPARIGFQHTRHGVYLFDTVKGYDGMPLFHGYTWERWNRPSKYPLE